MADYLAQEMWPCEMWGSHLGSEGASGGLSPDSRDTPTEQCQAGGEGA